MDRYEFRAKMYLVAAVVNIALTVILASQLGIVGAAMASAIAILLSSGIILNWYYGVRIGLDMASWWKSVLRETTPMFALAVVAFVCWRTFAGRGWNELMLGLLCWAVAFTLVSYFCSANRYEKNLIRSALRKVFRR